MQRVNALNAYLPPARFAADMFSQQTTHPKILKGWAPPCPCCDTQRRMHASCKSPPFDTGFMIGISSTEAPSTMTQRGTCLPAPVSLKKVLKASSPPLWAFQLWEGRVEPLVALVVTEMHQPPADQDARTRNLPQLQHTLNPPNP